jgi:hypothetical protein
MSEKPNDLFERMVDRVLSYKPPKVRKKQARKKKTKKKSSKAAT